VTSKHAGRAMGILALLLFSYVLLRASWISFTHDEAVTYLYGIRPGLEPLLRFDFVDANNHLLNTVSSFFSAQIFGPGELALRLPNVVAYGVYLWASAALARRLEDSVCGFCAFALLNLQPFLLDFFSLSRGYGLALACMMASLWLFLRAESADPGRARIGAGVLAAAAVLANLAFLNFYLALAAVDLLGDAWRRAGRAGERAAGSWGWFRRNSHWLLSSIALAILLAPVVGELQARDAFYLGGTEGFWRDTVGSLVDRSLYGAFTPRGLAPFAMGGVATIVVAAVLLAVGPRPQADRRRPSPELRILVGLSVLAALSTWLQHILLGTRFLEGRTGIFFLPLFTLLWIYGLEALRSALPEAGRAMARVGFVASASALALHSAFAANLSYTHGWRCDADTVAVVEALEEDYGALAGFPMPVRMGSDWRQAPVLNYYRVTRELNWLARAHRHGPNPAYVYELVGTGDREHPCEVHPSSISSRTGRDQSSGRSPNAPVLRGAEPVAHFETTESTLYRRGDLADLVRHHNRGLRFAEAGQADPARQEFARALALHPDHLATLHALARLETRVGFRDRALASWRAARVVDPYYPPAWIEAAELAFAAGDTAEARRLLGKALVPGFRPTPRVRALITALEIQARSE